MKNQRLDCNGRPLEGWKPQAEAKNDRKNNLGRVSPKTGGNETGDGGKAGVGSGVDGSEKETAQETGDGGK